MRGRLAGVVAIAVAGALALAPASKGGNGAPMSLALVAALAQPQPDGTQHVWVFFRDRGPAGATAPAQATVTPRALARRARRGTAAGLDTRDLPPFHPYVETVAAQVRRLRHESRWFNAVSVEATPAQVEALARLPFVERLDVVRRYRRGAEAVERSVVEASGCVHAEAGRRVHSIDYGTSLGQLQQIGVPAVHDMGLHGEGVVVAIFDAGFSNLAHEAFSTLAIAARHDFVNGDDDVGDGSDQGEGSHGTETLSVLGGFKEGQLVGPAYAATFLLAKTENTDSETPVEEDNWAAAAEWAEANGADVISSSLGYLTFDAPFTSYTWSDMNGDTAISTRAANLAVSRGVVVLDSAGNDGFDPAHNTLGAPADGFGVLAIAAVDPLGLRTSFSSVGPSADGRIKPDLAAQGSGVKAASPRQVDGYARVAGTSFSCPLTAGVVALVLQAHPDYTVEQVQAVLRSTASQAAAPDNLLGWGIVNAAAAVLAPAP
jgi:subtilisin family serine protease